MAHTIVAQGGTETHYAMFYDRKGGDLVDDDRYAVSGTLPVTAIVTPSGASGVSVPATATRISTGYYSVDITAAVNATLSTLAVTEWKVRYTLRINGVDRSFEYDFAVVSAGDGQEGFPTYNSVADYRRGIADETKVWYGTTVNSGGTLELQGNYVSVMSVTKNGAALLSGTDYSFKRPWALILTNGLLATDELVVRAASHLEDSDVQRVAKDVRARIIDPALSQVYTVPFTKTSSQLNAIDLELVRNYLLLEFGPRPNVGLTKEERQAAMDRIKAARAELQKLVDGDMPLRFDDGTVATVVNEPDDLFLDIQVDASD